MDDTPKDIVSGSQQIGDYVAEGLRYARGAQVGRQNDGYSILGAISGLIDEASGFRLVEIGQDREAVLRSHFAPYVDVFLALTGRHRSVDTIAMLEVPRNSLDLIVPIDILNPRAVRGIRGRVRGLMHDPDALPGVPGDTDPAQLVWLSQIASFVTFAPVQQASRNFFQLFTLSFWQARNQAAQNGPTTVHYTVDSAKYGYQLEYWPQFLYSPVVFGATLTRPVSDTIPINHYHFQGWSGGVVTPDGGLYFASASNPSATLRAF